MRNSVRQILRYRESEYEDASQTCFGYAWMCKSGKGYLLRIWVNLGGHGRVGWWDDGVGDALGGTLSIGGREAAGEKWEPAEGAQSRSYPLSRGPSHQLIAQRLCIFMTKKIKAQPIHTVELCGFARKSLTISNATTYRLHCMLGLSEGRIWSPLLKPVGNLFLVAFYYQG